MRPRDPLASPVDELALDRPLPGDVLRRVRTGLSAYQNYPVFSRPWLRGRTLRVVVLVGGLGALIWLGAALSGRHVSPAGVGYFVAGFTLIGSIGPALATWVRHRRWRLRRERPLVIGALLAGVVASAAVDGWASGGIAASIDGIDRQTPLQDAFAALLGMGVGVGIYAVLGGGLALPRYFSELRRLGELRREQALAAVEARRRELDVQLGLLQAQVEPHFLFNSLASVHALIASDPAAAQRLVHALVDYLRATIPRLRAATLDATLGQQLDICTSYLAVMQTRMGGRLAVELDVAPALRDAAFPPLLLMTLVENSIKHGIEPRPGPACVAIRARATGEALEVEVRDDGAGLRAIAGGGLGLANLRASLAARYGERAGFTLTGGAGGGACATIRLPLEPRAAEAP